MTIAQPICFNENVETHDDGEAETIAGLNGAFDKILHTTAKDYGHAVRSVHAKAHGILQGAVLSAGR